LLSGMILLLSHYLLNSFHQLNLRGSNWSRTVRVSFHLAESFSFRYSNICST
jgi:hypothetical protein